MIVGAAALAWVIAASQHEPQSFSVAAGSTLESINRLAAQADVDVVVAVDLRGRRSPAIRGSMSTQAAFRGLLEPVGARAVDLGGGAYRIESLPRRRVPSVAPAEPVIVSLAEVVVTGPLRQGGLEGANGRSAVPFSALERLDGGLSSDVIADQSSSVDSTRQGNGRNKLFIRGVADSAFSGPLQATVGQYFGDVRLTYGSPDPDLALIDMAGIEVFEGPQGARFGAGSIGGVVRFEPVPPDLDERTARLSAGASATAGGAPGADMSAIVNTPVGHRNALRLAVYARHDGGFVDSPALKARDVDGVDTVGARLAVRRTGRNWTVDVAGLGQRIAADDAQTADRTAGEPEKTRRIAEPYASELMLLGVVAHRRLHGVRFTSATSVLQQRIAERFDASLPTLGQPAAVDRRQDTVALSSEVRLESDRRRGWSWTGGAAVALGRTQAVREHFEGDLSAAPVYGVDLERRFFEGAVFGEAILTVSEDLRLALGGRISATEGRHDFRWLDDRLADSVTPDDGREVFFTPSAALTWRTLKGVSVFARLEQGVRPGSLSETNGMYERFRSDRLTLVEAGVRTPATSSLWAEMSLGWIDWRDMQGDVATIGGALVTTNIGDGQIGFIQAKAAWRPFDFVEMSGSVFFNDSDLKLAGIGVIGVKGDRIPNVAPLGGQLSLEHTGLSLAGMPLSLSTDLRYVGRSVPGLGPGLDLDQGGYLRVDLGARVGGDHRAVTMRVTNATNEAAIRYGVGSPYQLSEPQGAPLRPLTFRLSYEATF